MTLQYLEVKHFRCVASAKLELSAQCNVITGANGSGKTTLLEAIYFLGTGHSFRSSELASLIQTGHSDFLLTGKLDGINHLPSTISIHGRADHSEFKINGESANSLGELVRHFPVQVIDPEIHRLLEDGPSRRRKYIDWGVFHVEHSFYAAWKRFNRALKQRNTALKLKSRAADAWNNDIIVNGNAVTEYRKRYLESLTTFVDQVAKRLLNQQVSLDYQQGWKRTLELADALSESKESDLQRGVTSVGPHRADLVLKLGDFPAKNRISRGQQKLLACVLILAQQLHRTSIGAPPASLLLDDPGAELDLDNLGKLLQVVSELRVQLIVNTLSTSGLNALKNAKLFHVEHGNVKAMA